MTGQNDDLVQKIRDALGVSRPSGSVWQQPEIKKAIEAIRIATGTNNEEIMYRAIRLYLQAYLLTHRTGFWDSN